MTAPFSPDHPDSHSDLARRAIFLTLAAVFLALCIADNGGRYSVWGMIWLSLAIASSLGAYFRRAWPDSLDSRRLLHVVLIAGSVVFAAMSTTDTESPVWVFPLLLAVYAAIAVFLCRVARGPLIKKSLFPLLLICQAAFGVVAIQQAHQQELDGRKYPFHVRNDVQTFVEESARLLTQGKNPYSVKMPNVMGRDLPFYWKGATDKSGKLPFGYPYLPLSLFWSLPGYWLGDPRLMHVLAFIGAAGFLAYARPSTTSKLAATLFLLFPSSLFVLAMSWTEPVAVFFLAATVFCAFRAPKWLFLTLGCLIASKQYTFFLLFLLPLLVPEKEKRRPVFWQAVGVALALSLPMALWDWAGFSRSVIEFQFKQPFRTDSLSYLAALWHSGGPQLSPLFGFAALGIALFWALKHAPRNVSGWCAAGAIAYLGFFAFNKQAFANYYFWLFSLLIAAIAIALPSDRESNNSI